MKTNITLDTNVIGEALKDGSLLRSYFSAGKASVFVAETSLTLDGLSKSQKIDLLALKNPRHYFNQTRWDSIVKCGVTFLLCPRIGLPRPIGQDALGNEFEYTLTHKSPEHTYDQAERQDRYFRALRYIEGALCAGREWLKNIESQITHSGGYYDDNEPWYINIVQNSQFLGEKAIYKRFGDWADADALAAHYAYGNDVFCTNDKAAGAGGRSVLSKANRKKLEEQFEMHIMSLDDLEKKIFIE